MAGAFAACQKESEMPGADTPQTTELTDNFGNPILNPVSLDFDASALTKVSIDATGKASWDEGDQILICCVDAEGTAKYFTSESVNLDNGTFHVVVEDAEEYYAVYPTTMPVTLNEGKLAVSFPKTRSVCTSFKDAAYYVAKTTAEERTFAFKPITTVFKCTVESNDVKSLYFRSMGGGWNYVQSEDSFLIVFDSDSNNPSIIKPDMTGQYVTFSDVKGPGEYYISVPAVGETASADSDVNLNGFIIKYNGASSGKPAAYYPNALTLSPGKYYILSTSIDDQIVYDYYISESGTGTGLTADSPASLATLKANSPAFISNKKKVAYLRDGANFHLIGNFTSPLTFSTTKSNRTLNFIGTANTTGVSAEIKNNSDGKCYITANFNNISFTESAAIPFTISGGTANFNNIVFTKSPASFVTITGGNLNVVNSTFSENTTQIFNVNKGNGNLTIKDTKFVGNTLGGTSAGYALIGINGSYTGKTYITNSIFACNRHSDTQKANAVAIQCGANNISEDAFLGINNCLFYDNHGEPGTKVGNLSNVNLGFAHCIINSTFVAKETQEDEVPCAYAIRCGSYVGLGYSFLANNVISNESPIEDPENNWNTNGNDWTNSSGSYFLRLVRNNVYTDYKYSTRTSSGNKYDVPASPFAVPTYTWTPTTYAWTWNGSDYTDSMITVDALRSLITEDAIDNAATPVSAMASDFMTWLEAQQYQNGNAFTVDLYENSRGTGACWPGCYQNN